MQPAKAVIAAQWPAPANVHAFTTTIAHGNLADHISGDTSDVAGNRQALINAEHIPAPIHWLNQVHGTDATQLPSNTLKPDADACYTIQCKTACAVLTADCLPLLVTNACGNEVAAIHAGWRGLLNGVIGTTIASLSSPAHELMVWLGPAISQPSFELNAEIRDQFTAENPRNINAFNTDQTGAIHADLYQLARIALQQYGITGVYGGDRCTYSEPQQFYSYRRQGDNSGRIASIIWFS